MNSDRKKDKQERLPDTLRQSSPAIAALLGAFTSFADSAFSRGDRSTNGRVQDLSLVSVESKLQGPGAGSPPLDMQFSPIMTLGRIGSKPIFRRSMECIAVGPGDRIYVLGDGEVSIFSPKGDMEGSWVAPRDTSCMAVEGSGTIFLGRPGQVEIYDHAGRRKGGFAVSGGTNASLTAIKTAANEILVADATARCIHRFTDAGKRLGEIGTQNKTRGFILPNRFLDMAVSGQNIVYATDPGRHRVSSWRLDGSPLGYFGKFGMKNPEDFVGCCNPVNIAVTGDGKIVTAEKVIARVKVFDGTGKLVGMIGPEHFDTRCTHLYLAADSRGRIIVGDPVRLEVKVFVTAVRSGGREAA